MRILVTGITWFAGRHLTRELMEAGHDVWGLDHVSHDDPASVAGHTTADLRDRDGLTEVIRTVRPDACVHLAAASSIPEAEQDPDTVLAVNIRGTINILEAVAAGAPAARVLVVSSSQVYGPAASIDPIAEDTELAPHNMYAISKAAADMAALARARHTGLDVVVARPENHTGPGQSPRFVVASFAGQIRAIRDGQAAPVVHVGNLDSVRGFTDVRDVVRAYRLLLDKGTSGSAYNIASGRHIQIGNVLDTLCRLAGVSPVIEVDIGRFRPSDTAPVLDTRRLRETTGWAPAFGLDETLADMLKETS
jgi:GDP-4-dehydro-6-deoxy-D-mannose reductase